MNSVFVDCNEHTGEIGLICNGCFFWFPKNTSDFLRVVLILKAYSEENIGRHLCMGGCNDGKYVDIYRDYLQIPVPPVPPVHYFTNELSKPSFDVHEYKMEQIIINNISLYVYCYKIKDPLLHLLKPLINRYCDESTKDTW